MKTLSLYKEGNSVVHKTDPISKILFILAVILVPIFLGSLDTALLFLIISLWLVMIARVFRNLLPIIGFTGIILITVVIIQSLFYFNNATPLFGLGGIIFYKEGLIYAAKIVCRIYAIINSVSLLMFTTKPSDLVASLVKKGLSPQMGYVFTSVLQIIPQMMSTVDTIIDAQRSRGMETEGSLFTRVKAFVPLIGPVVINSLIGTRERAMALEVRAFNSKRKKTFLYEENTYKYAEYIQVALIAIIILSIVWMFFYKRMCV